MSKKDIWTIFLLLFFCSLPVFSRTPADPIIFNLETETMALQRLEDGRLALRKALPASDAFGPPELLVNRRVDFFQAAVLSDSVFLAWSESSASYSRVFTARITNGRLLDTRLVFNGNYVHSLALHPDVSDSFWLAFVEEGGQSRIVIQQGSGNRSWTVSTNKNTRNLVLLGGESGSPWLFWLGGTETNEVNFTRFNGTGWQEPEKAAVDQGRSRLFLAGAIDRNGYPRLAWSEAGKRSYSVKSMAWLDSGWSEPEQVCRGTGTALEPRIVFPDGLSPWVFWNQRGGRPGVYFSSRQAGMWSPEHRTAQGISAQLVQVSVLHDRLQFLWLEENDYRQKTSLPREISAVSETISAGPEVTEQDARDENRYLGFGDSITLGYIDYEEAPTKGYIPRLEILLKNTFGQARVTNAGIGAEITSEGLQRLEAWLESFPVLYTLIMEGTNDVILPWIPMETAAENLGQMIDICREQGVIPLLATIPPRNDFWWHNLYYRERIFELNDLIRELCLKTGTRLVEQFEAFYNYPEEDGGWTSLISNDYLHPNEKGYQFMAGVWFQSIRSLKIDVLPPVNLTGIQIRTRKIDFHFINLFNHLSWQANPENSARNISISKYRIYRKEKGQPDSAFLRLTEIPASRHDFSDRTVQEGKAYVYGVSSLDQFELESEMLKVEISPR